MATSVPICDICMTDDTTKPASVWCAECEEAICKDCEQQHSRMKLTKNHQPIPIEDYQKLPSSVADITQECKVHNRKLDFYCLIHNEPCCVSCVSQKHDTCKTSKPLTEVVEGVKSSAAFEDLEDRAKDISELICNLIKDKQDNKAIKLTNIRSFQTPDGESRNILITGIDMFDDGRIVLADSQQLNKRLVIMNQKGGLIKTVPVVEKCFDVAVIDKDTVATTLTYERKVIIVDINLSKVQRTLPMKDNCYGIISTGEQFVVSLWNKTIQFFDLSGKTLSTLSTADYSFHCSVLNDKLYYTTFTSDAVD